MDAAGLPVLHGRSRELAACLAAVGDRSGYAGVLIRAESGLGRTRLAAEVAAQLRGRGAEVLPGGCTGPAARTWPLGAFPAELAGDVDPAVPSDQLARSVEGRLRDLGVRHGSLLLVLDDMQWADDLSLTVLEHLGHRLSDGPVRLLVTARSEPDVMDGVGPALRRITRSSTWRTVTLPLLEQADLEALVAEAAPELPRPVRSRLARRGAGNPLLTRQLALAVVDAGDDQELPAHVRDVMLDRVRALPEPARCLAVLLAILGRPAEEVLLGAAGGLPAGRLRPLLRYLVDHRLVAADRQGRYLLRDALFAEVLLADLLPDERREGHRALALVLDAARASRSVPVENVEVGLHLWRAGEPARALPLLVAAARAADRDGARARADECWTQVLLVWGEVTGPAGRAGMAVDEVLYCAAGAARWVGRRQEAVELVRRALLTGRRREPGVRAARHELLGVLLAESGDLAGAAAAYRHAESCQQDVGDREALARARVGLATVLNLQGRYQEAAPAARAALAAHPVAGESVALGLLGVALAMSGAEDDGIALLSRSLDRARETGATEDVWRAYGNLAFALENAGRLRESFMVASGGLVLMLRGSGPVTSAGSVSALPVSRAVLATNAACALLALGYWDVAVALADAELAVLQPDYGEYLHLVRAEVAAARGAFDDALRVLASCAAYRQDEPQFAGWHRRVTAEVASWQQRPDQARRAVRLGLQAVNGSSDHLLALQLAAVGLRVEADEAVAGRRRGDRERTQIAESAIEALTEEVSVRAGALHKQSGSTRDAVALVLLAEAEVGRAAVRSDAAEVWSAAAAASGGLSQRYRAAYCQARHAAALLAQGRRAEAASVLPEAAATAAALGAHPLLDDLNALAQRAWVARRPAGPTDPTQLSARERQVLQSLAAGGTNADIGRQLFLSPRTVGVHVSSILRKLGARSRTEAVAIARHTAQLDPKEN